MSCNAVPLFSHRFEYDKHSFDPHQRATDSMIGEIPADSKFIAPIESSSWAAVRQKLEASPDNCKLIFFVRHGQAQHNVMRSEWSKCLYSRYITQNPKLANPDLTEPRGRDQAQQAGALLRDALLAAGLETKPSPSFYSSCLRRCISTTEEMVNMCRFEKRLIVADGFREWMGYDHTELNDRRATRSEILQDTETRGFDTKFLGSFPEQDEMFERRPLRETYTDVDIRWENSLNTIFEKDQNSIICICSNNRALQSCFRVIGHKADATELRNDFGIMNMRNGAVVAFLVTRIAIDPGESKHIQEARLECKEIELNIIKSQKKLDDEKALRELIALAEQRFKGFLSTVGIEQEDRVRKAYEERKYRGKSPN